MIFKLKIMRYLYDPNQLNVNKLRIYNIYFHNELI